MNSGFQAVLAKQRKREEELATEIKAQEEDLGGLKAQIKDVESEIEIETATMHECRVSSCFEVFLCARLCVCMFLFAIALACLWYILREMLPTISFRREFLSTPRGLTNCSET